VLCVSLISLYLNRALNKKKFIARCKKMCHLKVHSPDLQSWINLHRAAEKMFSPAAPLRHLKVVRHRRRAYWRTRRDGLFSCRLSILKSSSLISGGMKLPPVTPSSYCGAQPLSIRNHRTGPKCFAPVLPRLRCRRPRGP
jgi:hypothetical protein